MSQPGRGQKRLADVRMVAGICPAMGLEIYLNALVELSNQQVMQNPGRLLVDLSRHFSHAIPALVPSVLR